MKSKSEIIDWLKTSDHIRVILVEIQNVEIQGSPTTLYLSSRPFVTSASDSPANTSYEACITGGVSFSETLSLDGSPSIGYGDIEVENVNGIRDNWLNYIWTNKPVTVYIGDPRWPKNDFRIIFQGLISDISSRSQRVLNLILVDKLQKLNNPITENVLGGSTNNKDRIVPLTFGECFNVEPLLITPSQLEYKVHQGQIEDIIEVRDNGAPVSITKNLSNGTFKLNQTPVGQITASVQGDASVSYVNKISDIIKRILVNYGPANVPILETDIDTTSFNNFSTTYTQPTGIYISDRVNMLEACQSLARSIGASLYTNSSGKVCLVRLDLQSLTPTYYVTPADIEDNSFNITEKAAVKGSIKLGYCKNYIPQTSGLAGGIPASNLPLFNRDWLTVTATDSTVLSKYEITSEPVQEDTLLLKGTDANTEATRRLNMWKTPRYVVSANYYSHMLLTELGDVFNITNSRFGFSGSKTGMVVSINRNWLSGRATIGVLV